MGNFDLRHATIILSFPFAGLFAFLYIICSN